MHKIILIILITILLTACTPIKQTKTTSIVKETNNHSIEIHFCPQDNCSKQLINLINSANSSVYCTFYEIELQNIIDAIEKAPNSKLITNDDRNQSALMHNKFCVIDDKTIATGSFNPTFYGDSYNNNNLVIIHSKYLAQNYKDEFNELQQKRFAKGDEVRYPLISLNGISIENYFCPDDECAEKIYNELKKAKTCIYFMTFTFTHNDLANMLVLKHHKNITVRGIIEKSRQSKYSKYDLLKFQGIDIIQDSNPHSMHHKVFIIDNSTVITGSMNPTWSADNINDENILIIHNKEIAEKYLEEFKNLFP